VRVGAAVTPWLRNKSDSVGTVNPFFCRKGKTVKPRLFFKPIEFDGFKKRVVELLPDAQKLDGISVSQPILDYIICPFLIFIPRYIGDADIIILIVLIKGNLFIQNINLCYCSPPAMRVAVVHHFVSQHISIFLPAGTPIIPANRASSAAIFRIVS